MTVTRCMGEGAGAVPDNQGQVGGGETSLTSSPPDQQQDSQPAPSGTASPALCSADSWEAVVTPQFFILWWAQ